MATKNTPSVEELRAQLAAAEKAQEELNERRMQARHNAELAWNADFVASFEGREADLISQERAKEEEFRQAVRDHDLLTALALWSEWRSFRYARNALRSVYQNASYQTGKGRPLPDLRVYDASPFEEMVKILDHQAAMLAEDKADKVRDELEAVRQAAVDEVK